jgi:hypothetical protein
MWLTTPFSLSYDVTMHSQPRKNATKIQKKQPPITTNQCRKLPNYNKSLHVHAQENQRHDEYELQSWWIKV